MSTQGGGDSTRERILAAAIAALDKGGDAAVRVTDVAHAAGVTQGMVTYHFRRRDLLVMEAQRRRFDATTADDVGILRASIGTIASQGELVEVIAQMIDQVLTNERGLVRVRRLSSLGHAATSDESQPALVESHTEVIDEFTELIATAQQLGLVKSSLSPRAVASVITGTTFGLVLNEFDARPPTTAELAMVINSMFATLLADPDAAH
jgi:AcrR family transcriptional regulator